MQIFLLKLGKGFLFLNTEIFWIYEKNGELIIL